MTHLRDVYQDVTNTIIAALQSGTPPWVHPWDAGELRPLNLSSGRHYRGINVVLLNLRARQCGYRLNRWLTYQQAKALGAHVRKGEQGTDVILFKLHELGSQTPPDCEGSAEERRVIPLMRSFTVFNAAQIADLPAAMLPEPAQKAIWQACEAAEAILETSGADIRHGGSRAYYNHTEDRIQLPEREAFASATDYARVALHELTHWTGAPSRCNRPLLGRQHIEAYAFEELVAEMGAAFLCNHCGLQATLQHAAYIESWLKALKSDKKLIFTAATQAQRAADFVLTPLEVTEREAA